MFSITIAVGDAQWRLLYKESAKAQEALEQISLLQTPLDRIILTDDFEQALLIVNKSFHGYIFEDLEKTKMAHVELGLHQARVQAAAQKAAQADPGLRANAMMNGPGVLSPMNSFRPS